MNRKNATRRYVLTRCPLQFPDHDFKAKGYKIIPSGYYFLVLNPKSGDFKSVPVVGLPSLAYATTVDKHGRVHIETPTSGDLFMRNRGNPWFKATGLNHLDDLQEILGSRFSGCMELLRDLLTQTDGGADYSPHSFKTYYVLGKLFLYFKLGSLTQIFHAAGESFLNYIERVFSNLNIIDGVYLPDKLVGETHTPNDQSDLSKDQRNAKH